MDLTPQLTQADLDAIQKELKAISKGNNRVAEFMGDGRDEGGRVVEIAGVKPDSIASFFLVVQAHRAGVLIVQGQADRFGVNSHVDADPGEDR